MIPRELQGIVENSPFWAGMNEEEREDFAEEVCNMYGEEFHDTIYGCAEEMLPHGFHIERIGTDRWMF